MSEQNFSESNQQKGIYYNYEDYCDEKEAILRRWAECTDQSNLYKLNNQIILQHCDEVQNIIRMVWETNELSHSQKCRLQKTKNILHLMNDEDLSNMVTNTIQYIDKILQMFDQAKRANTIKRKIIEQCRRAEYLINSIGKLYDPNRDYEWEILVMKSHLERFPEIHSVKIQRQAQLTLEQLNELSSRLKKKYNQPEAVKDESANEDGICRICYQQPRSYAAVPCGHLIYCQKCKDHVRNRCMMCRQPVTSLIRIFF